MMDFSEFVFLNNQDGWLYWKERSRKYFERESSWKMWNSRFSGKRAGTINKDGYVHISILNKIYKAHRVIWFMFHGEWPKVIDHENGDKLDNRIENLRNVTQRENSQNNKLQSNNTSGFPGVGYSKLHNKWTVRISHEAMNRKFLGLFDTKEEAIEVRMAAEKEFGYHPNNGRSS